MIKLVNQPLLNNPIAGVIEFYNSSLYFTNNSRERINLTESDVGQEVTPTSNVIFNSVNISNSSIVEGNTTSPVIYGVENSISIYPYSGSATSFDIHDDGYSTYISWGLNTAVKSYFGLHYLHNYDITFNEVTKSYIWYGHYGVDAFGYGFSADGTAVVKFGSTKEFNVISEEGSIFSVLGNGNVKIENAGSGIMLTSPDGNTTKVLRLGNDGNLELVNT